nr:MAG TPA: hypothetical protein [Caudoviricetes sp.]
MHLYEYLYKYATNYYPLIPITYIGNSAPMLSNILFSIYY